jgi:type I restriction enzyme S subunit
MSIIKALPIFLPPVPLQTEYVTRLRAVQANRFLHEQQLVELDELFASLQARAFHGAL